MSKRLRNWFLTINNPTEVELKLIDDLPCRYCVWSWDTAPSTKTRHVHIYYEFNKAEYFTTLKNKFPRADISPRQQARSACRGYILAKEEPHERGSFADCGHRTKLDEVQQMIHDGERMYDIANEYFPTWVRNHRALDKYAEFHRNSIAKKEREMYVEYVYGAPGSGKTHYAFEQAGESWYILSQAKSEEQANINVWFDGYEGERCLIIDDFDGWIPYRLLLRILDKWPLRLEIKGGSVTACFEHVIITSNIQVEECYPYRDIAPLDRRINKIKKLSNLPIINDHAIIPGGLSAPLPGDERGEAKRSERPSDREGR